MLCAGRVNRKKRGSVKGARCMQQGVFYVNGDYWCWYHRPDKPHVVGEGYVKRRRMDKKGLENLKVGDQVYLISGYGAERVVPKLGKVERVTETQIAVNGKRFYRRAPKNVHYGMDRYIGSEVSGAGTGTGSLRDYIFPVTEANTAEAAERKNQFDLEQITALITDNISSSMFRSAGWEAVHQICNLLPDLKKVAKIKVLLDKYPVADPAEAWQIAHLEQEKEILLEMIRRTSELSKLLDAFGVQRRSDLDRPTTPYEGAIPRPTEIVRVSHVNSVDGPSVTYRDMAIVDPSGLLQESSGIVNREGEAAPQIGRVWLTADSPAYGDSEITDPDKAQDTEDGADNTD